MTVLADLTVPATVVVSATLFADTLHPSGTTVRFPSNQVVRGAGALAVVAHARPDDARVVTGAGDCHPRRQQHQRERRRDYRYRDPARTPCHGFHPFRAGNPRSSAS
jgi:hypothetical protein